MWVSHKPISLPFQYNTQNNSSATVTISPKKQAQQPQEKQYHYTVKVINPGHKSEYKVETLKSGRFTSTQDVKDQLSDLLKCKVTDIGYIEPGHGLKGKQQTLIDDDDIDEMYDVCKIKRCGIICGATPLLMDQLDELQNEIRWPEEHLHPVVTSVPEALLLFCLDAQPYNLLQ